MNIYQMRKMDFYFGAPICLLLDIFDKLIRPIFIILKKRRRAVKSILVMKYFGIGSIILSSPMIRALRKKFPQARIVFLTFDSNREVVEMFNLADYTVTIRTKGLFIFFYDTIKALISIWFKKPDIAIDLEFFAKFSTIMNYLSGARIRVGFYLRQMWRGDLLTHHVYYNPYHHVREVFLALGGAVGAYSRDLCLSEPRIPEEDNRYIEKILAEHNILPQDRVVVVNCNVGDMCIERRWPLGNFTNLVNELSKTCAAKFAFIGAEEDKFHTDNVISVLHKEDRVVNLCGMLNLKQLANLLKRSEFLITNDSGPLHLAASIGTPTVSFFGPETPTLYGPTGDGHLVFYKNLYCSPCLNVYNLKTALYGDKRCFEGENKCMQAISVGEVVEEIKKKGFLEKWQK